MVIGSIQRWLDRGAGTTRRGFGKAFTMSLAALAIPVEAMAQSSPEPRPAGQPAVSRNRKKIAILLYPDFETLDVFGPVQMWGRLSDHEVVMVAEHAGPVLSSQGVSTVATYSFETAPQFDILMIPGGNGARKEVSNPAMLEFIKRQDKGTSLTTSVCTGSAILARTGLLNGKNATTNKRAYKWATSQSNDVNWKGHARWVEDGKYMTSSGVSAGTDMALAIVEKIYGRSVADRISRGAEYVWNNDPGNDPFAVENAIK